jgi:flagellar basal body-associated protein FliL
MENSKEIIIALTAGVVVLSCVCITLFILLYRSMRDNATLQYQNASFTAETSQEKTFTEIYNDLTKIIKEVRQINYRLEHKGSNHEPSPLKH